MVVQPRGEPARPSIGDPGDPPRGKPLNSPAKPLAPAGQMSGFGRGGGLRGFVPAPVDKSNARKQAINQRTMKVI